MQKLDSESTQKQKEIQQKFMTVQKLGAEHISKGPKTVVTSPEKLDEDLTNQYEEHASSFEQKVREANREKQGLREEILALEQEMRGMRDELADQQTSNRAMQFILTKEEHLSERKSILEERALRLLQGDLESQIMGLKVSTDQN